MKRFVSLLLVVGLLMGIPVTLTQAEQTETVTQTEALCSCGCGKNADEIQWKPYNVNVDGAPSDGHYYLEGDYAQGKQYTIMSGDRVVIDLRGYTLTTSGYSRLFLVYGYLAVLDSVGGGRMCSKTSGAAYGGVVMVAQNETYDSTFALHGGILTVAADNKSSLAGGIVTVGGGCHFIMYGGMILGGSTTQQAGAIRGSVTSSDIQILGGSIIGGEAATWGGIISSVGNVTLKDCFISGGQANGATDGYGGNVFMDGGSLTVENATIESGSAYIGGNIYTRGGCKVSIKNSTIRNGYARNNGGNLYFGKGTQQMENSSITGGVAAGKGANLYKTGEATLTTVNCQFAPAIGNTCPHCKQAATWEEAGETLSGHCYLTEAKAISSAYIITGDVVLDLRGYDITSAERAFKIESGATLTVIDTVGGATVSGSGVEGEAGGVIYNDGTLNIYGGNFVYVAGKTVASGGVIYTTGNVTIHGGLFDGSAYNNTVSPAQGGVLHMTSGKKTLTMTAGRVLGGTAYYAGAMAFEANNTVNITGVSIYGGSALHSGGNIRFNGAAAGTMINATFNNVYIDKGAATDTSSTSRGYAGNISVNYANLTLNDCIVTNGTSVTYAGSITCGTRGFLTANRTLFANSVSKKGGNIYTASYVCGATFTDCALIGGQATSTNGGNLMINQGNVKFYGGMIAYGSSKTTGGNVYNNGANYDHKDAKDDGFRVYASQKGTPIITGGKATSSGGNIYSGGFLLLDAAFINNGTAASYGDDIYYTTNSNTYGFTVGSGLTGNIVLYVANAAFTGSEVIGSSAVEFAGQLLMEGRGNKPLTVQGGKLVLGNIAVVAADGSTQWVADMAAAQAAWVEGGYIQIFADTTLELTKDCAIDLNGYTLTVSGDYTLYGMDSTGDGYTEGTGKVVLTEGAAVALRTTVADGREYISIQKENEATLHRLGMRITDVTLRPDECGVYYKASWDCDPTLAALIDSYGLSLSVYREPGANFVEDKLCLETTYDGAELVSGEKKTGILIRNILKDSLTAGENETRGGMPIYTKAYLKLKDGTQLLSGLADYSLKTTMERLDALITEDPTTFRRYTKEARAFYETWKENGMTDWNLTNIPTPVEDDVIEVLMIGSSYCYYYVEELYGLAKAAGIKMRVCNVYYSGCKLDQHYNWWVGNKSNYQFYVTDENGRRGVSNVSLEYCLAQGDWDFFSLQQSNGPIRRDGPAQHLENVATYTDALIPYLQSEFPKAEFLWHQTWAVQIGYDRDGYQMTTQEQQIRDTNTAREFAIRLCEKYNVRRVNSGEAWMNVRYTGYDNLCARLTINNGEGDYYHDGDIGGGQYLNACVWFETLTGLSCVGNTYRPTYTHNGQTYTLEEDFVQLLQECAHKAVVEKNNEY